MKRRFFTCFLQVLVILFLSVCCGTLAFSAPANNIIKAGVSDDVPPVCFRDSNAELVGFDVDLLREIGRRIGKSVQFVVIDWEKKIDDLNDRRIDLIASNLSITEERKKLILYTAPLIHNAQAIIVNAASPIHAKKDLGGQKVCLLGGSNAIPLVEAFNAKSSAQATMSFSTIYGCLTNLIAEDVGAAVLDRVPLLYYSEHNKGQFRILTDDFGKDDLAYGMRKSDGALIDDFNKALAAIEADGTMKTMREKWFGEAK